MNKFKKGDKVVIVNDVLSEGVVVSSEPSYHVKWGDGTETYMVQENALRSVEPAKTTSNPRMCEICDGMTWHNIHKQLGRVFYRCQQCGKRSGEMPKNDSN